MRYTQGREREIYSRGRERYTQGRKRERDMEEFIIRQKGIKFIGMWRAKDEREREGRERGGGRVGSLYRPIG